MNIIRKGQRVNVEEYALCFDWKDEPGAGFSFPCTAQGEVLLSQMKSPGIENFQKCQSGEYAVTPLGVKDFSHTYYEPAQLRCSCHRIVVLDDAMTNSCECDLEYNGGGQLLAPRSQWGDEWTTKPETDYGLY